MRKVLNEEGAKWEMCQNGLALMVSRIIYVWFFLPSTMKEAGQNVRLIGIRNGVFAGFFLLSKAIEEKFTANAFCT